MIGYAAGTLIYTFAIVAPVGWHAVSADICKAAYGVNFDGYIFKPNGAHKIVRAHCYRKEG